MIAERLPRRAIAYESQFDQRIGLKASYLSKQIDTFIGERLNVCLSKNKYEIKNGLVYGQDIDEPFVEVMKRGVDYRQRAEGENRVDKKREEAEVEGFSKIQAVMLNPSTPAGTMMLSVSPKGGKDSLYQHNFYDIFTLEEVEGKRFVEFRRYSSALTIEEYKDKLSPLKYMENISSDADFLGNPLRIDNLFFENAERIHSYLHKEHRVTEIGEFERIKRRYQHLKSRYYATKDPLVLDAMMNIADEEVGLSERKKSKFYSNLVGPNIPLKIDPLTVDQEINYYGNLPVREVATGCGSSGSTSKDSFNNSFSPFSISDFGLNGESIDYEFDQNGPCKKCNAISVKCGPCGICKACDLAIRASQKFSLN